MPIKYCEALTLKYVYGLSVNEIAEFIETPLSATRKRIETSLAMLNVEIKGVNKLANSLELGEALLCFI